jgi:hypothetical protein
MLIVGFTVNRHSKFTVAGLFPNVAILGLFMADAFQVESIRRLSAENGISTVYAPGLNRPVWNLLLELNSQTSVLATLSKAQGTAATRDIAHRRRARYRFSNSFEHRHPAKANATAGALGHFVLLHDSRLLLVAFV